MKKLRKFADLSQFAAEGCLTILAVVLFAAGLLYTPEELAARRGE